MRSPGQPPADWTPESYAPTSRTSSFPPDWTPVLSSPASPDVDATTPERSTAGPWGKGEKGRRGDLLGDSPQDDFVPPWMGQAKQRGKQQADGLASVPEKSSLQLRAPHWDESVTEWVTKFDHLTKANENWKPKLQLLPGRPAPQAKICPDGCAGVIIFL